MIGPDSELRPHPEDEKKPRWLPVGDEKMVTEGTLGYSLVWGTPDLGVRPRPETTFNQPLTSLWRKNSKTLLELQKQGMQTVREVLSLRKEDVAGFVNADDVGKRMKEYVEGLSIPPHGKLIKIKYPCPPEREQELKSKFYG